MKTLRAQVHSLQVEINSLRQQRDQLTSDKSFLHIDVLHLKEQLDRPQEEIAEGLALISDLIQQVGCSTPLEGQLALSQMENANLRRQLAEHLTICDQLKVAELDRDRAIAKHHALLHTINSAILGSQSIVCVVRSADTQECHSDRISPCFCYPGIEVACRQIPTEITCSASQAPACSTGITDQGFFRNPSRHPAIVVEPLNTF